MKTFFNHSDEQDLECTDMAHGLRAHGYKLTAQRLAILQVVREGNEHLTPLEVLERGSRIHRGLGLTTVYRTLELLSELGFVRRVHLGKGCHAYARVRQRGGHHLVCRSCHRVVDFPCFGLAEVIEEMGRRTGFDVELHLLELAGLCPSCQERPLGSEQEVGV